MRKYEVYLRCSVAGELGFPYETEAESAREAGEDATELADSECLLGGTHTVARIDEPGRGIPYAEAVTRVEWAVDEPEPDGE